MITGGESYFSIYRGPHTERSESHPDDLSYVPTGGIGMFNYGFLDTHFGLRGR
jgi:hypothetical protein